MPLRNRVTPFGTIEELPGRGTMMGNRGVLHNDRRELVRGWDVRRWITCVLRFRGRHREVMQPNRYTELFFLDEAAAFAAGHRPCAECRNADFKRFIGLWRELHDPSANAERMDARLHEARLKGPMQRTYRADVNTLPDGTFVRIETDAWLLYHGALHRWSDRGYGERRSREGLKTLEVLTPRPIVEMFAAGYVPMVHITAE